MYARWLIVKFTSLERRRYELYHIMSIFLTKLCQKIHNFVFQAYCSRWRWKIPVEVWKLFLLHLHKYLANYVQMTLSSTKLLSRKFFWKIYSQVPKCCQIEKNKILWLFFKIILVLKKCCQNFYLICGRVDQMLVDSEF